ncbi:MAG: hypothetical protein ACQUHE_11295 [Bacteroidia bacterium]
MDKQHFTPEGVLALQEWLYQLPNALFDEEILAMNDDFEAWSLAHLELTEKQLEFYDQLGSMAKNNLAYNVTLAATFKKPIKLEQLLLRDGNDDPVDKLFKPKSSLTITSQSNGNQEVDGEVIIEVTYLS